MAESVGAGCASRARARTSSSSRPSIRRRISASGRCSRWSRRISRRRARSSSPYLAPGPDWPGPGNRPAVMVVAHRPRRDPGQVGELGERVASVVWHGRILTVRRCTVKTTSTSAPRPLHTRSTPPGEAVPQTGSEVGPHRQGVSADAPHHRRDPADRRPRHRRRDHRHDRLPGRAPDRGHHRGRRHRHDGRRPRVRRRLRLAPVRLRLRPLRVPRSPPLPRSSCSGSSGRSSSAAGTATGAELAGVPAGRWVPAAPALAGQVAAATTAGRRSCTRTSTTGTGTRTTRPPGRRAWTRTPASAGPAPRRRPRLADLPSQRAPGHTPGAHPSPPPHYDAAHANRPRRRRRSQDRPARARLPRARRVRGADRGRRPVRARDRSAAIARTSSSSTSACPGWTVSRSPASCAATRPSRS